MKKLLAVIVAFLMILTLAPTAFAAADTTPPVLIGIGVNSPLDGVSFKAGDTLTVIVEAIDLESGVDPSTFEANFSSTINVGHGIYIKGFSPVDGTNYYRGMYTFDGNFLGDTYVLNSIYMRDKNPNPPNGRMYYHIQDFPDISIKVDNVPPPNTAPVITDFKQNQNTAVVGDTVTFTVTAQAPSGVASATMYLDSPNRPWYMGSYNIPLSPVPGQAGVFSGQFKITSDMHEGWYLPRDFTLVSNSGVSAWHFSLPNGCMPLRINNPSNNGSSYPVITSFSMSSHNLIPGQTVKVTATIGNEYPQFDNIMLSIFRKDTVSQYFFSNPFRLYPQGNGIYSGTVTMPVNFQPGEYCLNAGYASLGDLMGGVDSAPSVTSKNSQGLPYLSDGIFSVAPLFTVSGTDNETILVGQPFDVLQGVTVTSAYSGDITNKMKMQSCNIDTSESGIYLIKYVISDTIKVEGADTPVSYTDYRWLGISEIEPSEPTDEGEMPLAVTDGNLAIGTSASDASIKKNGVAVPFTSEATEPGEYMLSTGGSSAQTNSMIVNGVNVRTLSGNGEPSKTTVTAVIDRSGPVVQAAWATNPSKAIVVSVRTKDMSGVAQTKYIDGTCTIEQCRSGGTSFTGSFTVAGYGKYTLYACDGLGNESVTTLSINTASSSNSAFLENVGISAGSLSRMFTKTYYSYKITLPEDVNSVTITPQKEFDGSVMTMNGKVVSNYTVSLANGKSTTVKVKVTNGKSNHTYKFMVTRAKSTYNLLSSLSASVGGTVVPFTNKDDANTTVSFDPNVTTYYARVGESAGKVTIAASGNPSKPETITPKSRTYSLQYGQDKPVTVKVKSQSGHTKTYTVHIIRSACSNADLKSLKINLPKSCMNAPFNKDTLKYAVTLPSSKASVTLSIRTFGYKATAVINNSAVGISTKKSSMKVTLSPGGSTTLYITVTAQDGKSTKKYEIDITRGI